MKDSVVDWIVKEYEKWSEGLIQIPKHIIDKAKEKEWNRLARAFDDGTQSEWIGEEKTGEEYIKTIDYEEDI